MSTQPTTCPGCGSNEIRFRKSRGEWICDACDHRWTPSAATEAAATAKARLFLSYGRHDAGPLAERMEADLRARGYEVWRDKGQIRSGKEWEQEIQDGLRSTQLVVALLSPHAVRVARDPKHPAADGIDGICLDELSFARFACKVPIVPVMALPCDPPFVIFRLDYVDLCAWRDSDERYQAGLRRVLEAIEAGLRGEVRFRAWEHRLRPWDFAAFLHEKRRDFCGRQWLFDEIDAWRASSPERVLLITGDPGVGKSAIVAELVHRNPGEQVLAYHCCQADIKETLRPGRFVRSLAAMIASQLDGYAAQLDDPAVEAALGEARCAQDPASAFEEGILAPLERLAAPADGVRYILVDALDEALTLGEGLTIVDLLAARRERLPGWLRLVATTRKEPAVLDRLRGLRAQELDAQDPRNLGDLDAYLVLRLGQPNLAERLTQGRLAAGEAGRILRAKSAGNFLWVQQALQGIERDLFGFDRLDELPPGLDSLYFRQFERLFPDEPQFEPARRVLEVVVAAAEPLTEAQLAAATGLDSEQALPRALRTLADFVPEGDGRYKFYHKSVADWLTHPDRRGTIYYVSRQRGHERLAELGWSEYRRDPRLAPYTLAHLPTHLAEAGRSAELAELLCDPPFLEAKAEAGMVFDLVGDFEIAVQRIPAEQPFQRLVRLLEQALRLDINFVSRHPTVLFQCLWNRCWWYDSPEAAGHYDPPPGGWPPEGPPWQRSGPKLCTLMERWREAREQRRLNSAWLRSLRPPEAVLGGNQQLILRGHEGVVWSVAFDLTGRRLASGSGDGTTRVWDATTGAEAACLVGPEGGVRSVAFDPAGRRLASGSVDGTVWVWNTSTGAPIACLRGHESAVHSVSFDPTGERLASGSGDASVRVWDAATGAQVSCFRGHEGVVWSVAFDPTGRRIASGSDDRTVRIWDVVAEEEVACLRGHVSGISCVAFDPSGRQLASGSADIAVWDAATGAELASHFGRGWVICSVAFDSTGRRLVSGSLDCRVRVWNTETGAEVACLSGHEKKVRSVAFDPSGRRIASGSEDKTVRIWDVAAEAELACLRGHKGWVRSVAFDPAGRRIATGSHDMRVRVWNADTGAELACLRGHRGWVVSVAFDRTGQRLASGSFDKTVRVWDAATGAELACLLGHERDVGSLAFDPAGRFLASGANDRTVRIWDTATGAELACLRGHGGGLISLAFDPAGRRLSSRSAGVTRIWDTESWECLEILSGTDEDYAITEQAAMAFAWRALTRGLETVIEPKGGGEALARFSPILENIATHPSGRTWAGSAGNHLYLMRIEG